VFDAYFVQKKIVKQGSCQRYCVGRQFAQLRSSSYSVIVPRVYTITVVSVVTGGISFTCVQRRVMEC
jgi:hypothetical protein